MVYFFNLTGSLNFPHAVQELKMFFKDGLCCNETEELRDLEVLTRLTEIIFFLNLYLVMSQLNHKNVIIVDSYAHNLHSNYFRMKRKLGNSVFSLNNTGIHFDFKSLSVSTHLPMR